MDEVIDINKSANQLWKESGTSLSFKDWIQREKDKGVFIPNKVAADSLATIRQMTGLDAKKGNMAPRENNTILGLNKWVVYTAATVIAAALAYNIYQRRKG